MAQNKLSPRVLIVDDELLQRKIVARQIELLDFICETAANAAEAMEILQARDFDVVLLDVQMTDVSGLEVLPLIKRLEDAPEVVMLTLDVSLETGIAAMREGAYDYLTKPAAPAALDVIVRKAAEKRRLARQNSSLRDFIKTRTERAESDALPVQANAVMREIVGQADAIAPLASTVLITGESGTGKDILARYIHNRSPRSRSAMVSINCGAMPETLFESEFFGYEKGAFTGANQLKRGLLEAADGSTLFLDEIGEMPLALQVKLLRFLESGEYRRVGGTRELFADARVIAATNRDLTEAVRESRFRADLYYRLNVIEMRVPPLRERSEDLAVLIDYFLEFYRAQFGKPNLHLTDAARHKLLAYEYPGNVRELKNVIERAAALASGDAIEEANIFFQKSAPADGEVAADNAETGYLPAFGADEFDFAGGEKIAKLEELERRHILSVLTFAKGNRTRAADLLGISERTLYRRLRDYE